MLSPGQRDEFSKRGFVRIPRAFPPESAALMEDRVWDFLGRRHGVDRGDPATWSVPLGTGLQRLRTHAVFESIGGAATVGALDDLLGEGRWERPKHWGQFLVSFPEPGASWTVPHHIWHTDFPYWLPVDRPCGALVFSFLGAVPPGTGGTAVIEGSPGLVASFVEARPKLRRAKMKVARRVLMGSDPWLAALASQDASGDRVERFMRHEHEVAGLRLRVAELTGEPGDVVIGHPWLLHSPSPNCGDRPRIMRVARLRTLA